SVLFSSYSLVDPPALHSFPTRRSSDLGAQRVTHVFYTARAQHGETGVESVEDNVAMLRNLLDAIEPVAELAHIHLVQGTKYYGRSEEHTSELQSRSDLVCRLLLEKKKK